MKANNELFTAGLRIIHYVYEDTWPEEGLWHLQKLLYVYRQHGRLLERERAKSGFETSIGIRNRTREAQDNIQLREERLETLNAAIRPLEKEVARTLLEALYAAEIELSSALIETLGVMGAGAFDVIIANIKPQRPPFGDELIGALGRIVEHLASTLNDLRRTRRHLQLLRASHQRRLKYLQQQDPSVQTTASRNELAQIPRSLAEVESRAPLIDYELYTLEERLVLPLVALLDTELTPASRRTVIVAISQINPADLSVVVEPLWRSEPHTTNTLLALWQQIEQERQKVTPVLMAIVAKYPIDPQLGDRQRFTEVEQPRQQVARLLIGLWGSPLAMRWIEQATQGAVRALADATSAQARVAAIKAIEQLLQQHIQSMQSLIKIGLLGRELLHILDVELDDGNVPEHQPLAELLDRLEMHIAEAIIAAAQQERTIELQRIYKETLALLGPETANVLADALRLAKPEQQREDLEAMAEPFSEKLMAWITIMRTNYAYFAKLHVRFMYVFRHREMQTAQFGFSSYAPIEVNMDRDEAWEAAERSNRLAISLASAIERAEQAARALGLITEPTIAMAGEQEDSEAYFDYKESDPTLDLQERIDMLTKLLEQYRRNLQILLEQEALMALYIPPSTAFAIDATRNTIRHIKQLLRALDMSVPDKFDD